MRNFFTAIALSLGLAATATAQGVLPWYDNYDPAPAPVYVPWPGSPSDLLASDTSHFLSAPASVRAFATNPGNWTDNYRMTDDALNGYNGQLVADVYVWDDNDISNTPNTPVNAMLAYVGANNTASPGFGTDYFELGIISGNSASLDNWVVRARSYDQANGTTWFDTGVSRASLAHTWTHLQIVADAQPGLGGDGLFHAFINGAEVVTDSVNLARNPSVGEQWVRVGSNSATVQNFWYDNLSVVPEPSSIVMLGLGGLGLAGLALRRRTS
jgi:PEP-CTERM motif